MCSFDIISQFTCIPVNETIEICLDKLYEHTELVHSLKMVQLKKLLNYCLKENHFSFENHYYDQTNGVAMGSPLGSTSILANIFMSHFEEKALNKYDVNPPLYYKRYVDDTFFNF